MADCYEPQVGNIYHPVTEELIGVRDPVTLVFTPVGDWTFVEDKFCPPPFDGLDFSHPSNSQYVSIITGGGLPNV